MKYKPSFNWILLFIIITLLVYRYYSEENETELFIENNEIMNFTVHYIKGNTTTSILFTDELSIKKISNIFSNLEKEENMFNLSNPKYYVDILYKNEKQESFHLWISSGNEKSYLMKLDNEYIIYTFPTELNNDFNELLN